MTFFRLFRLILISFACSFCAFAAGCAADDDSESDDDSDDDSSTDDDATPDDDGDQGWPVGEYEVPCAQPLEMPDPYRPHEAMWLVARFDDADLPVQGLYAYYWLDWYMVEGCSWSSNWAVLYKNGGAIDDNFVSGEFRSGFEVDFGSGPGYDVFVRPRMHVYADAGDPFVRHLDLYAEDFEAHFALRLRHIKIWSDTYFAAYDSTIEEAAITIGGETYHPTGAIDFERWWETGGYAPGSDEDNLIFGAWLYEPFSWRDETGARVDTLIMYWLETDGESVWVHLATGVMSVGAQEFVITALEPDFDFPENDESDGYPLRHAVTGQISDGREFSYEVSVVKEFHDYDHRPPAWADLTPPQYRAAHSLNEGALSFDGATFNGGGVYEWRITDYNPLPTTE